MAGPSGLGVAVGSAGSGVAVGSEGPSASGVWLGSAVAADSGVAVSSGSGVASGLPVSSVPSGAGVALSAMSPVPWPTVSFHLSPPQAARDSTNVTANKSANSFFISISP